MPEDPVRRPWLTAIIVTYNSAGVVAGCLTAIRQHLASTEIVIVDNASTDDTIAVARAADPRAHIVRNNENLGFGRACNRGAECAAADWLMFVNPDTTVTAADIGQLREALIDAPSGLLVPLLKHGTGSPTHLILRNRSWAFEALMLAIELVRPRELRRARRITSPSGRAWAGAALLLARAADFTAVGGFDERYFLYYEDQDLSRRFAAHGLAMRTTAAVRGEHVRAGSTAETGSRSSTVAWARLSWIQMLSTWSGVRTARHAWHLHRAAMRGIQSILRLATCVPGLSSRASRKLDELDELSVAMADIRGRADAAGHGYAPEALTIVGAPHSS